MIIAKFDNTILITISVHIITYVATLLQWICVYNYMCITTYIKNQININIKSTLHSTKPNQFYSL